MAKQEKFELPPDMKAQFDRAQKLGETLYARSDRTLIRQIALELKIFHDLGASPNPHDIKYDYDGAATFILYMILETQDKIELEEEVRALEEEGGTDDV